MTFDVIGTKKKHLFENLTVSVTDILNEHKHGNIISIRGGFMKLSYVRGFIMKNI